MSLGWSSVAKLRVLDLGTGMGAALSAKMLADMGMKIDRVAPAGDEVFDMIHPAHRAWRASARPRSEAELPALLAAADICIVGGEDHPSVAVRRDAKSIAARHPGLVVVDLTGYVAGEAPDSPATDLLVQARSGLTAEQYSDRPLSFAVPFPTYGQAMLAVLGTWVALLERLGSGVGQIVSASLQQGAAHFMLPMWLDADNRTEEFNKVTPKDVEHLIFECADGTYVQFVMGVPSAVQKLYRILDIDIEVDPDDRGIPRAGAPAETFFGNRPLIAPYVRKKNRDEILAAAAEAGLPAGPVQEAGEAWADPQVLANRILQTTPHGEVVGSPVGLLSEPVSTPRPAARPNSNLSKFPTLSEVRSPLSGVRVLDLGSYVAGPFASKLLADLGADVIKIEGLGGDPNRGLQRHFIACQSGKRNLVVDLKTPDGADMLDRLLAGTDVVTHNFRLGVAERLGLSPERIRQLNPEAITLHSMAFGPVGPLAKAPGFDMVIQALVGLERRAGGAGREPLWYRTPYLDYAAGTLGAIAVLGSMYELRAGGRASDAWVSLLNTGMYLMADLVREAEGQLAMDAPLAPDRLGFSAAERIYPVRDGWVAVVARSAEQRTALAELAGGDNQQTVAGWLAALDAQCALQALHGSGVWAEKCSADGLEELRRSPAARAAGAFTSRTDHAYGRVYGPVGPLVTLSRNSFPVDDAGGVSLPGEDTFEILMQLGYSAEETERLAAEGTVRGAAPAKESVV
jgi:crotonobetainyl-CoA:carnitine CoA-transferase CaiB-like acyl-CoA transferase